MRLSFLYQWKFTFLPIMTMIVNAIQLNNKPYSDSFEAKFEKTLGIGSSAIDRHESAEPKDSAIKNRELWTLKLKIPP